MALWNSTQIRICRGVDWDNSYNHVRLFDTQAQQLSYFARKQVLSLSGGTYQRESGAVRYPVAKDDIQDCNYIFYQNQQFNSKWFFAFITKMEYVNANVTDIFFETDVFQTWFEPGQLKESFVVREHVAKDEYGKYRLDEGLACGDYIEDFGVTFSDMTFTPTIIMAVSEWDFLNLSEIPQDYFDNTFTGLAYFRGTPAQIRNMISVYQKRGKGAAIVSIFMFPAELLESQSYGWLRNGTKPLQLGSVAGYDTADFQGYRPKNKKCLQYPFRVLCMYADGSQEKMYKYENFTVSAGVAPSFTVNGGLTPGSPIIAYPNNYNWTTGCTDEYISLSGWPVCGWVNDTYANWLAQNQRTQQYNLFSEYAGKTLNGVKDIFSGGLSDNLLQAIGQIAGTAFAGITTWQMGKGLLNSVWDNMIQEEQHKVIPDSANGAIGAGNAFYSMGKFSFHLWPKCARREYVEQADKFFTMFGYKVNELKVPNIKSRKSFNFLKLADANLNGAVPVEAHNTIKRALENGVTFWHTNDIYNYDLDNSPA